ncbi:hypothetical protein QL285_058224 [Trifolium repens]|nr:hypothetical protein QL285_058224 [Trifolium repens]
MGDEQSRDYCGKVNIKQEPEWTPPHNNNSSEGIFWDDLADIEMESEGENFSDISKPFKEERWKLIPSNSRWEEHVKWIKKWMKLAPKSKFYAKRPYSAKRIRIIEYQKHVVREWLHRSDTVFVEDYTQDKKVEALINKMERELEEKCNALKDKKRKHREEEADGEFIESLAKRLQLPPKKEDPESVTIICQIGKAGVNALCDVGSSVNVMSLYLAEKFKLITPTAGTTRELTLVDQSTIHVEGMMKDVLVKVEDLVFPADFMILDIQEDEEHPIILGRPFLATSRALTDVELAELTLRIGEEKKTIKASRTKREVCYMLEWKDREATPPTPTQEVQVKIEIEELENEMAQLKIETAQEEEVPEELTEKLKRLTIEVDVRATWVKARGRYRKVAKRSKFGVNTPPLKKPAAEGRENNRVKAEKEQKKEHPPKGKGKSIIKTASSDDDGRLCFATFKEKQDPEKYEKSNMKKGGAKAKAPAEERDMRTYPL